jgi:hypothetical protein
MICPLSDEERAALRPARPEHEHRWGLPFRSGEQPGKIGHLFERRCKCGAYQVWRGTQWGRLVKLIRTID